MDFANFFSVLEKFPVINNSSSGIVFRSDKFSTEFVLKLYSYLKSKNYNRASLLNISCYSLTDLKSKLEVSFLGLNFIYFIKDLSSVDLSKKREIYNYLDNYTGPHIVIIFDNFTHKNFLNLDLPIEINSEFYIKLYQIFYPEYSINKLFIQKLFKTRNTISIDIACTIMMYQSVIGNKYSYFFDNWLDKILLIEKSLFTLSQALFDRKFEHFFNLWHQYKNDYPNEFWVAFWSDQIWQASLFALRANQYSIIHAKKYAQKLPFSFVNKTWQNYSFNFLSKAHAALYKIDFNLKNSALSNNLLEFWFYKFLLLKNF